MLEVADTPEKRTVGLMGRTTLPQNSGMLFVFEREEPWSFWMKDTLIPLDFIWISEQGVITYLINNVQPEPGKSDDKLTIYQPGDKALYTIEVNAGTVDRLGLKVGATVSLVLH